MKILAVAAGILMLSACNTMHFVNGPQIENTVVREQWHHLTLSGLIEISPPMDVNYNCADQQWDTVTVEQNFMTTFVGAVSQPALGLSLYTPWSITYSCREPI